MSCKFILNIFIVLRVHINNLINLGNRSFALFYSQVELRNVIHISFWNCRRRRRWSDLTVLLRRMTVRRRPVWPQHSVRPLPDWIIPLTISRKYIRSGLRGERERISSLLSVNTHTHTHTHTKDTHAQKRRGVQYLIFLEATEERRGQWSVGYGILEAM